MNDPNGLIHHRGRCHLFYQHNPAAPVHRDIHWGHAVSADLVHWEHLPVALAPQPGTPDADGCWSGCTVIADDGTPTILYTGLRGGRHTACLATALDDDLVAWRRHPGTPVIAAPPPGLDVVGFRDHTAWREDRGWCQLMGAGIRGAGGAALLYRSPDLRRWRYAGPLLTGDGDGDVSMWECPDFFALGDRHALVVSAWDRAPLNHALWFTGDYADGHLEPRAHGLVDHGRCFYAPQSFSDDRGRRLMLGWLVEDRPLDAQLAAGWSGVMSLPRELGLDAGGVLTVRPAAELAAGRGRRLTGDGARGRALEVVATLPAAGRGRAGVADHPAPDGSEQTTIVYDAAARRLVLDAGRTPRAAPLDPRGDTVRLHVFVDHSVVEVFADERLAISGRVYPTGAASDGVRVIADGVDPDAIRLEMWERPGIWGMSRTS